MIIERSCTVPPTMNPVLITPEVTPYHMRIKPRKHAKPYHIRMYREHIVLTNVFKLVPARFDDTRLMNLPHLIAHRLIQNAYYITHKSPFIIAQKITFRRTDEYVDVTIYCQDDLILQKMESIARRLTTTELQTSTKLTIRIPKTFSPLFVMIQLPYLPTTHLFNEEKLMKHQQLRDLIHFDDDYL